MKRHITLLLICLWALSTAIVSASGTISGTVYTPNTERGMQIARSDAGAGMMWDMSAPKNKKNSERAEIWLIGRNINFAAIPYDTIQKWYQQGVIPANQPIYKAAADEKGKFEFKDIPANDYYVMILDPNGKEISQNLTEKVSRDELLKKLPHADEFELFMVGMRSCLVQKVTLRDGQKINIRPGII